MKLDCLIIDDEKELADNTCEYFNMFEVKTAAVYSSAEARTFLRNNMQVNGLSRPVMLVSAGTRWYQAGSELEFYIDDMDSVDLTIQAIDQMQSRTVKVDLDNFPVRPKRATRVKMSLSCPSESLLKLKIEDMGFGTMFPASDACVEREIPL